MLDSLSIEHKSGAIARKFTPSAILGCLKFASNLKPGVELSTALADACEIIFGDDSDLAKQLRDKQFRLPGIALMRMSRVRLDMASMLYERKLFLRFTSYRYMMLDSSPQLGHNFLVLRARW